MDNTLLAPLLDIANERQYWIKPVGDPQHPPQPGHLYDRVIQQIDFAKKPNGINLDDLLFVYAVGQSKLIYIADCYTPVRQATDGEIAKDKWRERWSW